VKILKSWSVIKKLEFPQKKVLWGLVGITICVLVYFFGILPLVDAMRKAGDEIFLKKNALVKYEQYLRNRKAVEEELSRTLKQYEGVQQKLLSGETPQLGAANLQEIAKRISEKDGIGIRSFRILEPKELNSYRKISIQIDFNPVNSMVTLGQFMYDIEHHEKELMISEMDLLVMNPRLPNSIQGSLVISGVMKNTKTKEKGRAG
jgi:hypothetical protein